VVGCVCLLLGIIFLFIHVKCGKRWVNYPKFCILIKCK
jgi:hypothetical protein